MDLQVEASAVFILLSMYLKVLLSSWWEVGPVHDNSSMLSVFMSLCPEIVLNLLYILNLCLLDIGKAMVDWLLFNLSKHCQAFVIFCK